ncbi:hypothetical protein Bbelb_416050 [Branchiostoma belcheri]|nr:hypothetical protein Bbelb_416050 [Branchiostoma belcheri]
MDPKIIFARAEEKRTHPRRNNKGKLFRLLVYHRLGVLTSPEKQELQELLEEERKKDLTRITGEQGSSTELEATKGDIRQEWLVSEAVLAWGDSVIDSRAERQPDAQKHRLDAARLAGDEGKFLPASQTHQQEDKIEEKLLSCQNHRIDAWARLRDCESTSSDDGNYDGDTLMFCGRTLRYTSQQISFENLPTF